MKNQVFQANKTPLLTIFLFFFTGLLLAQNDVDITYADATWQVRQGKYDKAIQCYKHSLKLRLKHPFIEPNDIETIKEKATALNDSIINSLAKTYRNIGTCHINSPTPLNINVRT